MGDDQGTQELESEFRMFGWLRITYKDMCISIQVTERMTGKKKYL